MNAMEAVEMNRTTSTPESVLHNDMGKDPTSIWYSDSPCLVSQVKKTGRQRRVILFI